MKKLSRIDLLKVSLRLVFIQSAWNETSMQLEGLTYSIAPALRKIHTSPEKLKRAVSGYKPPFNTHPFLVGIIAGVVLKMEEEGKSPRKIHRFLRTSMSALAAVGDPFFKGTLPPIAAIIASLIALGLGPIPGAVALILVFNVANLLVRTLGLFSGYREGTSAIKSVVSLFAPSKLAFIKTATALLAGITMGIAVLKYGNPAQNPLSLLPVGLCLVCAAIIAKRRNIWVFVSPVLFLGLFLIELLEVLS